MIRTSHPPTARKNRSLFFDDLLDAKVREFNPRYAEGALLGQFGHLHADIYGTREDIVFLINGIPVLVIECKNANKGEAIALGVGKIHRFRRETPELVVSQQLF